MYFFHTEGFFNQWKIKFVDDDHDDGFEFQFSTNL